MDQKAQMIAPETYPQMLSRSQLAQFSQALRSSETAAAADRILKQSAADRILKQSAAPLREAILTHVAQLEAAGQDQAGVSAAAHEIKGFADTAGLSATARIAEGLCRYLEQSDAAGAPADATVVALHVSAIGRAARDSSLDVQVSEKVTRELALLAAHKLAEARKAGSSVKAR